VDKDTIRKIRAFNRYYTAWLDVMNRAYLGTAFSWPESRVLFEIYLYPGIHARELCEHLGMDKGYVSRILARFEQGGLLTRELVPGSKGIKKLGLTAAGREKAQQIDRSGDAQILEKLGALDEEHCHALCRAMAVIEKTLRENEKGKGHGH